ncbi:MAG: hypothetical protein A2234_03575 [Elusimicrobia bacterium RIFOXYA2_FULL_58_8]|nr:MAG: hypothetical protein A2234_03575 [Elusimicrobia bacterium RIFOXYA2_FULL_58_8]
MISFTENGRIELLKRMKNKLSGLLCFLALLAGFAASASAQNLYITTMTVGDGGYTYCNNGLGTERSFITSGGNVWNDSSLIQFERPQTGYPGSCLSLCVAMQCVVTSTPSSFGIDDLTFEVFKFGPGANPLDPASTPPIKTISMYNIGTCTCESPACAGDALDITNSLTGQKLFCASWDGYYNLNGFFGKTNGIYGYRAKVTTRQTTRDGTSIDIEQTAAFPGQNQIPIQVNVTNIHMVQSSPTAVGNITRVPAQPYNLKYRLSKDATATINIYDTDVSHQTGSLMSLVRTIISAQPRVGEGVPDGVLSNGDFWDGRNSSGTIVPAGSYMARIEASSNDDWAINTTRTDLAWPATIQLTLDPLQITDVGMRPLGASSTDMATVSYLLTEAATAYVEIYTPGTLFENTNVSPPVLVAGSGTLVRRFSEQQEGRRTVNTYWDGRDQYGVPVCDGNYVFAVYAELPSVGQIGGFTWSSVKTRRTVVGTVPVARGQVLAFVSPSSTVIGSSPTAAGLDPFYFRYTPERNTKVTLKIKNMDGSAVRTLVNDEVRFANLVNRELWDGKRDNGTYVSSGTYLAELMTTDPYVCASQATSTMTVMIPVDMFRIVDVRTSPLLGGASAYATVSYELSQTMYTELNIYPVTTIVRPDTWPPSLGATVYSVRGLRPGRMRISEPWEGRDQDGWVVEDGRYPFTLVAYSTGTAGTAQPAMYATDKVYGYIDVSRGQILFSVFDVYPNIPTMYSSSETIKLPPYGIDTAVTRQSSVTVQIVRLSDQRVMADVAVGEVRDGDTLYKDFWDGRCTETAYCPHNDYVAAGSYNVRVVAQELGAEMKPRTTVQQTIDVNPIRIFDLSITPLTMDSPAVVSYQVSEPMKVATKIYKPGTRLTRPFDPVDGLVKLMVGVRPARTQIFEYWDGTDLTLSKVPDGNYVFKVYGSTVTESISTLSGDPEVALLADDVIVSNIPVIRSGTADLCGDFARETFFAPNPYEGTTGWFKIPAIMNGTVNMRIYNLAGDKVYSREYGLRAAGAAGEVNGAGQCAANPAHEACWPKVNSAGRTVAPGVYFAVIRFEATQGTRDVCQVVKKILIP